MINIQNQNAEVDTWRGLVTSSPPICCNEYVVLFALGFEGNLSLLGVFAQFVQWTQTNGSVPLTKDPLCLPDIDERSG